MGDRYKRKPAQFDTTKLRKTRLVSVATDELTLANAIVGYEELTGLMVRSQPEVIYEALVFFSRALLGDKEPVFTTTSAAHEFLTERYGRKTSERYDQALGKQLAFEDALRETKEYAGLKQEVNRFPVKTGRSPEDLSRRFDAADRAKVKEREMTDYQRFLNDEGLYSKWERLFPEGTYAAFNAAKLMGISEPSEWKKMKQEAMDREVEKFKYHNSGEAKLERTPRRFIDMEWTLDMANRTLNDFMTNYPEQTERIQELGMVISFIKKNKLHKYLPEHANQLSEPAETTTPTGETEKTERMDF